MVCTAVEGEKENRAAASNEGLTLILSINNAAYFNDA